VAFSSEFLIGSSLAELDRLMGKNSALDRHCFYIQREGIRRLTNRHTIPLGKIMLRAMLRVIRRDDCGQTLAEYCLITALISLIALGIFWHVSGGLQGSWGSANTTLSNAGASQTSSQQ
jgi:Flp pilus assembly pilin Flp